MKYKNEIFVCKIRLTSHKTWQNVYALFERDLQYITIPKLKTDDLKRKYTQWYNHNNHDEEFLMTSKICYVVVWCCFNFFQGKLLRSTSTSSRLLCSLIKHYNELTVCVPYVPGSSLMPSSQSLKTCIHIGRYIISLYPYILLWNMPKVSKNEVFP